MTTRPYSVRLSRFRPGQLHPRTQGKAKLMTRRCSDRHCPFPVHRHPLRPRRLIHLNKRPFRHGWHTAGRHPHIRRIALPWASNNLRRSSPRRDLSLGTILRAMTPGWAEAFQLRIRICLDRPFLQVCLTRRLPDPCPIQYRHPNRPRATGTATIRNVPIVPKPDDRTQEMESFLGSDTPMLLHQPRSPLRGSPCRTLCAPPGSVQGVPQTHWWQRPQTC